MGRTKRSKPDLTPDQRLRHFTEEPFLEFVAAFVEGKLHEAGYPQARCFGQLHVGLSGPDSRVVTIEMGSWRHAVRLKNSFDPKITTVITDLLLQTMK